MKENARVRPHESDDAIRQVFDAWLEAAQPERKNLSPSRRRDVVKLLRETQDVDFAIRAVRGFVAHRRENDRSTGLSGMNSYPGSASFADRIDWFADLADDPDSAPEPERKAPLHLLGAMQRMWEARDRDSHALMDMERVRQTIEADGFIVNHDADGRPVALRAKENE